MKKNDLLSIVLVGVIVLFICLHSLKMRDLKESRDTYSVQVDSLENVNIQLQIQNKVLSMEIDSLKSDFTDISKIKQRIKIIYDEKFKKINNFNADSIVSESKYIFSKNNIRYEE